MADWNSELDRMEGYAQAHPSRFSDGLLCAVDILRRSMELDEDAD